MNKIYKFMFLNLLFQSLGQPLESSLDQTIKQNTAMMRLFDNNLCIIRWQDTLTIKIYKNAEEIELTTLNGQDFNSIKNAALSKTQRLIQPKLPNKKVLYTKYKATQNTQKSMLKEQNALLTLEFFQTTPIWLNISSFWQLEEFAKYYEEILQDISPELEQKVPLLITMQPSGTKSMFLNTIYRSLNKNTEISPKTLETLDKYFYLVSDNQLIEGFCRAKTKTEALESFCIEQSNQSFFGKIMQSIDTNTILALFTLFLLNKILVPKRLVRRSQAQPLPPQVGS